MFLPKIVLAVDSPNEWNAREPSDDPSADNCAELVRMNQVDALFLYQAQTPAKPPHMKQTGQRDDASVHARPLTFTLQPSRAKQPNNHVQAI
jgi:hypothetical protein